MRARVPGDRRRNRHLGGENSISKGIESEVWGLCGPHLRAVWLKHGVQLGHSTLRPRPRSRGAPGRRGVREERGRLRGVEGRRQPPFPLPSSLWMLTQGSLSPHPPPIQRPPTSPPQLQNQVAASQVYLTNSSRGFSSLFYCLLATY